MLYTTYISIIIKVLKGMKKQKGAKRRKAGIRGAEPNWESFTSTD